jgi:norsolorinic acid ketoreductase
LSNIATAAGSRVVIVKIDNAVATDPEDAISTLGSKFDISHIDIVLANAGMAKFYGPALITPLDGFIEHLQINTVATLGLFIAAWPLLKLSSKPVFVSVSSTVGSIGDMEQWPMSATAYGASKAALNWVTRNLHIENPSLIAFPIHPGYVVSMLVKRVGQQLIVFVKSWVQTDMGNAGAVANGLKEAPTTVMESVTGMVDKVSLPGEITDNKNAC